MVQIHSPRPLLLEPAIYRLTNSRGAPGPGPGGQRSKSFRGDDYFASRFNNLRCVLTSGLASYLQTIRTTSVIWTGVAEGCLARHPERQQFSDLFRFSERRGLLPRPPAKLLGLSSISRRRSTPPQIHPACSRTRLSLLTNSFQIHSGSFSEATNCLSRETRLEIFRGFTCGVTCAVSRVAALVRSERRLGPRNGGPVLH